jgi:hypothetical protein
MSKMKNILLIISICFIFVETAWSQNEKYIEILRPYRFYPYKDNQASFIELFAGEIYLGVQNTGESGRRIIYGNFEMRLPVVSGNRRYNLIEDYDAEAAIKQKQQRIDAKLDSASVIVRKIILGKEVYQFDVSSIKTPGEVIRFASNNQVRLRFQNKTTKIVSNLNATFPDEYIRLIIPGIPTRFTEKEAIKNLEPIYDFDRGKYIELGSHDDWRFLQDKTTKKVFRTNENYTSINEEFDKTIALESGSYLKIDSNGVGAIVSAGGGNSIVNNLLYGIAIVIGLVFSFIIYGQLKRKKNRMGKRPWYKKFSKKKYASYDDFGGREEGAPFQPKVSIPPVSEDTPAAFNSFAKAVDENFSSLQQGLSQLSQKFSHFENLLISRQNNPEILEENKRLQGQVAELAKTLEDKETEIKKMEEDYRQGNAATHQGGV